jgi:hypothetical protein
VLKLFPSHILFLSSLFSAASHFSHHPLIRPEPILPAPAHTLASSTPAWCLPARCQMPLHVSSAARHRRTRCWKMEGQQQTLYPVPLAPEFLITGWQRRTAPSHPFRPWILQAGPSPSRAVAARRVRGFEPARPQAGCAAPPLRWLQPRTVHSQRPGSTPVCCPARGPRTLALLKP